MKFTRYHSYNNIMDYPCMREYLEIFFTEKNLELFPKEVRHLPLALAEKLVGSPWGGAFAEVVNQLLDAVQTVLDITDEHTRRCVSLWNQELDWTPEKEQKGGKDSVFLLTPEYARNTGTNPGEKGNRPAVIICPGGGYEVVCFSGEGNPVMNYMEAKGYVVFVLKYRTAPNRYPGPQEDLALAVQYVREHAGEFGVDAHNVMLMGFSAGGHLCGSFGCLYEEIAEVLNAETGRKVTPEAIRPDKLCLGYPVITFGEECHEGSFQMLTGGDESLRKSLSIEKRVTEGYPVTFLWTCEDDDCVPPSNAVRMAAALKEAGVPHKLCTYPSGGHGCNLAFGNSARFWTEEMVNFMIR